MTETRFESYKNVAFFMLGLFVYIVLSSLFELLCSRDISNDEWQFRQRINHQEDSLRGRYYGSN